jgi:hypothetical protein
MWSVSTSEGKVSAPGARRGTPWQWSVRLAAAAGLGVAMAVAVLPSSTLSQGVALVRVDVQAVAKGWRTSKLNGSNVTNEQDEKIGTIDDIVIGKDRVLFSILQVGGFLGLGGRLVAVPFQSLELDDTGRKIVLRGATKDALKNLPEFTYGS